VRKPSTLGPSSSHRRLALALLCAFAGCLNPRPEEYPSDTAAPGEEAAGAPAGNNPSRQGGDGFEDNVAADPNAAPDLDESSRPAVPPDVVVPGVPPDAGAADGGVADAGAVDAGAPAVSE
jgi:hypothetical protein